MTYSVYNVKIDNELSFPAGPTAGYVLSINEDGSTSWVEPQGGGGGGSTNVEFYPGTNFMVLDKLTYKPAVKHSGVIWADSLVVDWSNDFSNLIFKASNVSDGRGVINFPYNDGVNNWIYLSKVWDSFFPFPRPGYPESFRKNSTGGSGGDRLLSSVYRINADTLEVDYSSFTMTQDINDYFNTTGFPSGIRSIADLSSSNHFLIATSYYDSFLYRSGSDYLSYQTSIAKINKDTGVPDISYFAETDGSIEVIKEIKTGPDAGKVYIGGGLSIYNNVVVNGFCRLNVDGSLDTSFVPPTMTDIFDGQGVSIKSIELFDNEKIVLSGSIKVVSNEVEYRKLIVLKPDGSLDTDFIAPLIGFDFQQDIFVKVETIDDGGTPDYVFWIYGDFSGITEEERNIGLDNYRNITPILYSTALPPSNLEKLWLDNQVRDIYFYNDEIYITHFYSFTFRYKLQGQTEVEDFVTNSFFVINKNTFNLTTDYLSNRSTLSEYGFQPTTMDLRIVSNDDYIFLTGLSVIGNNNFRLNN